GHRRAADDGLTASWGWGGGLTTAYDATMNNAERAGRVTRRTLLGAASTAGLAGLVGCGGGADAPPPNPRPTPPTYHGPALPQLTVEQVLTGTDADVELSRVFRAMRVNDTVVLGGRDRDDQGAVAVLDLDAAEVRWERPDANEATLDSGPAYLMFSDAWAVDDGGGDVGARGGLRGRRAPSREPVVYRATVGASWRPAPRGGVCPSAAKRSRVGRGTATRRVREAAAWASIHGAARICGRCPTRSPS